MINLYNGDCMEAMAKMADKAYDLCIVDPPYGIGDFSQSDSVDFKSIKWNNSIPEPKYFEELRRISIKRVIWGANYYNCFEDGGGAIIWYKNIGHPSMSHCEIASVSGQKKVDYIHINWSGGIRSQQNDYCHPCQKPVKLYEWLLKNYAKPGDRILDTHGGSMSIAIACYNMGFDLDLYELDKGYFEAGKKRVETHMAQGRIFEPEKVKPEQTELGIQ